MENFLLIQEGPSVRGVQSHHLRAPVPKAVVRTNKNQNLKTLREIRTKKSI